MRAESGVAIAFTGFIEAREGVQVIPYDLGLGFLLGYDNAAHIGGLFAGACAAGVLVLQDWGKRRSTGWK